MPDEENESTDTSVEAPATVPEAPATVPESPATWENVVVGAAEKLVGRLLHNDEMVEEGEETTEIAHEVRDEYDEDRKD